MASHLVANSSIYRCMLSNSVFPVETKYRICVTSFTSLCRSNSSRAYCIGSARCALGTLYRARTMERQREDALALEEVLEAEGWLFGAAGCGWRRARR